MRRTSDDDHGHDHDLDDDLGHDLDHDHRQATGEGSSQATGDGHLQATGDGSDVGVEAARLTAFARGTVQGVGFRWWVRARALELGLVGHAANLDDGRVEIVAEGDRAACTTLLRLVSEQPSTTGRPGRVVSVGHRWSAVRGTAEGFVER